MPRWIWEQTITLGKPFAVGELLARIRAALRRSAAVNTEGTGNIVRFGQVEVDLERRLVKVDGAEIHLTPNEYKLLQVFVKYAGKVLTQRQLLSGSLGAEPDRTGPVFAGLCGPAKAQAGTRSGQTKIAADRARNRLPADD